MKQAILTLLVVLALCACQRPVKRTAYGWPSQDAVADSLSDAINEAMVMNDHGAEAHHLLEQYRGVTKDTLRALYFELCLAKAPVTREEKEHFFDTVKALADPVRDKYLLMRIEQTEMKQEKDPLDEYMRVKACLDYFRSVGDDYGTCLTLNTMGNVMLHIHDFETAIDYYNEALAVAKNDRERFGPRANMATAYFGMNDSLRSDSLLSIVRSMVDLASVNNRETVYRNSFVHTKKREYLDRGYAIVCGDSSLSHLRSMYAVMHAEYYIRSGDTAASRPWLEEARRDFATLQRETDRSWFYEYYYRLMLFDHRYDSAAYYMQKYIDSEHKIEETQHGSDVTYLEAKERIMQTRAIERLSAREERLRWVAISLVILVVALLAVMRLYFRQQKLKINQIQQEAEIKQNRKTIAATLLNLEEKDRLLKNMSQQLKKSNALDAKDMAKFTMKELENMVRLYETGAEDRDNFIEMFQKVNPVFFANLRLNYPNLKEAQVKLAAYIYAGMSNSQIARMLMVRIETVHQSRWRLRQGLGLTGPQSLEQELCRIANDLN